MPKNPYSRPGGGPKDGHTAEWQAWEEAHEQTRRDALTPEARKEEDDSRRQVQRRMNAELPF